MFCGLAQNFLVKDLAGFLAQVGIQETKTNQKKQDCKREGGQGVFLQESLCLSSRSTGAPKEGGSDPPSSEGHVDTGGWTSRWPENDGFDRLGFSGKAREVLRVKVNHHFPRGFSRGVGVEESGPGGPGGARCTEW